MPERVTREEKTVELAILKARETLGALRDGENTELDIVKLRRPKAQVSTHGIKQNQIHANAGGESFTSGKIKKSFDKKKMITAVRSARAFVIEGDRQIEKQLAKGVLDEAETKALKQLKAQVEKVYEVLTKQMNMLSTNKGGFDDFKKDDRDVEFTKEQQLMATKALAAVASAFDKITPEYLTAPLDKRIKMERDMEEITKDLVELTKFFGRSS